MHAHECEIVNNFFQQNAHDYTIWSNLSLNLLVPDLQGPILLAWFNFNPSMDK